MAVILYIEDNPDNMLLVKRALDAIGHETVGAETGAEGLHLAMELHPDLVLLDMNLPDMDGREVARRLRSCNDKHLFYVPLIALTAKATRGDSSKVLAAGCDVYMSKPVNIRELWARVESFLAIEPKPDD